MLDDFSHAGADGGEQVVEAQLGDHRIVHFQQQAHAVPFMGQLPLGGLRALVMQHVVDGHGHLLRHVLHEADFCFLIDPAVLAPEAHGSQTSQRRGQGNYAERPYAILQQLGRQLRESAFQSHVLHDQRLLRFPHQAARGFINRQLQTRPDRARFLHHQNVHAHDLAHGIMQHQGHVIQRHDARQALGKIMK
jgi:hypothetical protein